MAGKIRMAQTLKIWHYGKQSNTNRRSNYDFDPEICREYPAQQKREGNFGRTRLSENDANEILCYMAPPNATSG